MPQFHQIADTQPSVTVAKCLDNKQPLYNFTLPRRILGITTDFEYSRFIDTIGRLYFDANRARREGFEQMPVYNVI